MTSRRPPADRTSSGLQLAVAAVGIAVVVGILWTFAVLFAGAVHQFTDHLDQARQGHPAGQSFTT